MDKLKRLRGAIADLSRHACVGSEEREGGDRSTRARIVLRGGEQILDALMPLRA